MQSFLFFFSPGEHGLHVLLFSLHTLGAGFNGDADGRFNFNACATVFHS